MVVIDNRTLNLLSLSSALGAGSNKAVSICNQLNDGGLLDLPLENLLKSDAFDSKLLERMKSAAYGKAEDILESCREYGIDIITVFDEKYPDRLRNIPVPPVVLYVKGKLPDVDANPLFCIVGPRMLSKFGEKAAYALSRRLSKAGMITVSGTAIGADTAVHKGALSAGAPSVMVSAEGILEQMKSRNRALCKEVLERGCIISENPPLAGASKYSFPIRNRIMSGLSVGVAVVEAPKKSGALITAEHALEQDRDVFVIPGNPADKCYEGSNALLRDGAIPLLSTSDVFSRYIFHFPDKINVEKAFDTDDKKLKKNSQKKSPAGLSKEALLVYNSLVKPEFTIDDLSGLDMDGAALLSAVTELEMEHCISSLPGGVYKISDK